MKSPAAAEFPFRIESPKGLRFEFNANGSLRRMDHGEVLLNLFLGNELDGGPANLYLRRLGETVRALPLLGPRSPAAFAFGPQGLRGGGTWEGIRFQVELRLAESASAWFWHVSLENLSTEAVTLELVYAQDLGLANYWAVRLNEYYVSQYVDHAPLIHPRQGTVLAVRQNQAMSGRNPWCLIGALTQGTGFATDALQFNGLETRAGRPALALRQGLPGVRRQHEHSMAVLADRVVSLKPGEKSRRGFFAWFEADHPEASSTADLHKVDLALALPEAEAGPAKDFPPERDANPANLFTTAPLLEARVLGSAEIVEWFGDHWRQVEQADGQTLAFFTDARRHVVFKPKELAVLRPHGHILRSGSGLTPDESALTSTVWMAGVFHSMVTQGHVSINRFISTCHSYLGLFRSHGQRLFVELGGAWQLLDVPSAFAMSPETCSWYYRHATGLIRVEAQASTASHELLLAVEVLSGPPVRFLLSSHCSSNGDDGSNAIPARVEVDEAGIYVRAVPDCDLGWRFATGGFRLAPLPGTVLESVAGDEALFADGRTRRQPFICLTTAPATRIGFRITADLIPATQEGGLEAEAYWQKLTAGLKAKPPVDSPLGGDVARLLEILPWYTHDALIHYLAPRGLEQYSGGGWGTRDVTQGPVEMLLALGLFEPVRDLLLRVFKTQNADGDWPQWFMFFERERGIRPADSHGDIVYWPLLALAHYLNASEDGSILAEVLPFFHPEGDEPAERGTVLQHVQRALEVIRHRQVPGTGLAAYGHGDWNDSLQPVDPAMREHLCSAWTVTLHYQTLKALASAFRGLGLMAEAEAFGVEAEAVREAFQRWLVVDGVLAGFAYFHDDLSVDYLLHPRDTSTGIAYSALAMFHALLGGLFTPEQAERHLELIDKHLLGPDGARLFDRPMAYQGGPQKFFQRAESSSFFGREIGIMYTHAHLRYAEALWFHGDAEAFFRALCLANPIGLRGLVPMASLRQANCYYSSSDGDFADRYQADAEYRRLLRGEISLEGGWRVYSSGPGIACGLIWRCLFGLRRQQSVLGLDPVLPAHLDGLRVETQLAGAELEITYRIRELGHGPLAVVLNGVELPFSRGENPYRTGAALVPMAAVVGHLHSGLNQLTVTLA